MRDYTLIEGDLLDANADFICHQVNCQGRMASGVALAIRKHYPIVYMYYRFMFNEHKQGVEHKELLGKVQYVPINQLKQPKYCVNMFTQDNYGYGGYQYTNLDALKSCLTHINMFTKNSVVAFPWKVGCVRGGADWDEVLPLILETLTDAKEIQFYKLIEQPLGDEELW